MLPFVNLWRIPLMSWGGNTWRCPHWRPSWQDKSQPANVDLQLKQVNEEIYSRQGGGGGGGGQMSNARGKDGVLKKGQQHPYKVHDAIDAGS